MKKIFFMLAVAAMALCFSACETTDTEGLTRITYYPVIELEGDSYMIVDKGSSFQDPGFVATLNGEDISSAVNVGGSVNTAKSGIYSLTYSAVNADGFSSSAKRTVVVLDANDPIEGFWTSDPASYRLNAAGTKTVYGAPFDILIIGEGDGYYSIDDALGGYYGQRAGYGAKYYLGATLAIDAAGNIECVDNYMPGWGDYLDDFTDGVYDAATNTMSFISWYAGMEFHVILNK